MEDEAERDEADHRARCESHELGAAPQTSRGATAAVGDREHGQGGADRIGERQQDRAHADVLVGGDDGDRREHRPRAGDEDEAERRAEEEAATRCADGAQARERRKRPLEERARAVGTSRNAARMKRNAIARFRRKSCGSPSWSRIQVAKSVNTEKLTTSPAIDSQRLAPGRAAREQDRQDGKHARRDGRDDPGEQTDA